MSDFGALNVNVRTTHGKGAARTLRREGQVPAVMYGGGKENVSLSFDPLDLRRATDPAKSWNTFYTLTLHEDGKPAGTQACMIADVQVDSIKRTVKHVDFMRVDPSAEVVRKVSLEVTGRSAGIVKGGRLKKFMRIVRVAAKPSDIPVNVEVDITNVDVGESMRIKDISLENVRVVEDPDQRIVFVEMPKARAEEEETAEGEEKKPAGDAAAAPAAS